MRLRPEGLACGWRIVISPTIPQDSPPCYHSSMRHLVVLFIHSLATLVRLLGPGGVRSIVAESLLLKHQLLILNRSRQRSPNLFHDLLQQPSHAYLTGRTNAGYAGVTTNRNLRSFRWQP